MTGTMTLGKNKLNKIVSGGQTGADQAALDAAIKYGFSPWRLGSQRPKDREWHASVKLSFERDEVGQIS